MNSIKFTEHTRPEFQNHILGLNLQMDGCRVVGHGHMVVASTSDQETNESIKQTKASACRQILFPRSFTLFLLRLRQHSSPF